MPSVELMLECLNSSPCRVGFGESLHNLSCSSQMSSPLVFPNSPGRMQEWGRKNSSFFCALIGSFLSLHCAQFYSQFSRSGVSDSLWPHGLHHARPPCPTPTPGAYPHFSLSNWWCHLTISSSVVPFSSCLRSFPASRSSQMSQLFISGGQSIGVSASASVLPVNI